MSYTVPVDEDAYEARAMPVAPDPISEALGSAVYNLHHRFPGLHVIHSLGLRSPRLAVSRFYWQTTPPTIIDFRRELRYKDDEVDAKQAYFAELGMRYVVVQDQFDVEPLILPVGVGNEEGPPPEVMAANRPMTAPRRRRD